MKKISKIKKILRIIMIVLIVVIGLYVLLLLPNKTNKLKEGKKIKYDYILYERDTDLYKNIFNELESTINKDTIDYEKYAEYLSKLFIIDLYTLDNKLSKEDIGGIQYIYDSFKENFSLNAKETLYKYVESNLSNTRVQDLPTVKNIELVSLEKSTYKIEDKTYDSFLVKLKWDYKKDMGYDNKGTITLIKDNNELFIVEKD